MSLIVLDRTMLTAQWFSYNQESESEVETNLENAGDSEDELMS